MYKFTINFQGEPVRETPDLDHYRDALMNFDEGRWYADGGGASFSAKTESGVRCSLILVPHPGKGISLLASVPGTGGKKRVEFVSTSDVTRINEFVRTFEDVVVPLGSFVTPEQAYWAVEDYFKNPEALSKRLEWTPTSSLDFPEF
jgi:hypothetical protein